VSRSLDEIQKYKGAASPRGTQKSRHRRRAEDEEKRRELESQNTYRESPPHLSDKQEEE